MEEPKQSFIARIIESFLVGNFSILLILIALASGVTALLVTPREEDPQIVVPLADVMVRYPGGSAEEVEKHVASRLERFLFQIDGVEYVYSMSRPGMAVVTVRFYVGEDREDSLIKLYNKIQQNIDKVTPGITGWVVKPIEIDDVPIVNATLFSDRYDTHQLYRIAEEVVAKLQHIRNSARITIHGGERRAVYVYLDPERIAAYGLSALEIGNALKISNADLESGSFEQDNKVFKVEAGPFLTQVKETENLMVGTYENRPVYLRDVARVADGGEEPSSYSWFGFGPAHYAGEEASAGSPAKAGREGPHPRYPAVTIAVAKKKGSNAVWVANEVERSLEELRAQFIPDNVRVRITRDYGATANDKVNNLVHSLGEAVITVIALIALAMGWRTGIIVAVAVPLTYSLTLLVNYLFGYTINRVTLFALILALGLLVDDPIVGVENIYRHLSLGRQSRLKAISTAMNEVLPPIIMATLAIMVAFAPLFFISGMMGPYMRPMALNVPLAMLMSMLVSFTITPWLCRKLLRLRAVDAPGKEPRDLKKTTTYRIYQRAVAPFLDSPGKTRALLAALAVLFFLSIALALSGFVPLKMLPYDNKNEFQIVADMPEGTPLETTDAVVEDIENYLMTVPEVTAFSSFTGTASPMDFNGMVRHYYLRRGPHVADVRVNLVHRKEREMSSHEIILRIRSDLEALGKERGANLKLVEIPPGPPVLSTVVAEVYGSPGLPYHAVMTAAEVVERQMRLEPGLVDLDNTVEADLPEFFFRVDREKAGLNGISAEAVTRTLQTALGGWQVGLLHAAEDQNEVPLILRLPRAKRSDVARLKTMVVKGRGGNIVQLGELGRFENGLYDKTIFHKNQERVVYVTGEMAGRGPANAVLHLKSYFKKHPLGKGLRINWRGEGEWKITVDVFRDLGIAFSAALVGIYVLLVYETASFLIPVVIMLSIPLMIIGIMPGFWLLNLLTNRPIGGFDNPVFFTATAMIGMIALSGIVVRNAIILVDFINSAIRSGASPREAILESGAVRFRPIFLTAGTTMLGAWPITLDPIFSGLAWSIIFGMFVSTTFTLLVVPVVCNLVYGEKKPPAIPENG